MSGLAEVAPGLFIDPTLVVDVEHTHPRLITIAGGHEDACVNTPHVIILWTGQHRQATR